MADRVALVLVLLAVPLSGCFGAGGVGTECERQHPYAERLIFDDRGFYEAVEEATARANETANATWSQRDQGTWSGARGSIETVEVADRVHGFYDASPEDVVSYRVQDSSLATYGSLWIDRISWFPNGTAKEMIKYHAPDEAGGEHRVWMRFRDGNVTEAAGAEKVDRFHAALFPQVPYDAREDPGFSNAWLSSYELRRQAAVHTDALLADVVSGASISYEEDPFETVGYPHTLGTLHLEAHDAEPFEGRLEIRIGHDVRAIAVGNDPTLVLEVTPGDRVHVSNLGSAALGEDELRERAEETFSALEGLPELGLEEASYERGGALAEGPDGECSELRPLPQPPATTPS